jgi:hypothetical protein
MAEIKIELEGEIGKYVVFEDNSLFARIGLSSQLRHRDIVDDVGKEPIGGGIYFVISSKDKLIFTTGNSDYGRVPLEVLEELKPEIKQTTGLECEIKDEDC